MGACAVGLSLARGPGRTEDVGSCQSPSRVRTGQRSMQSATRSASREPARRRDGPGGEAGSDRSRGRVSATDLHCRGGNNVAPQHFRLTGAALGATAAAWFARALRPRPVRCRGDRGVAGWPGGGSRADRPAAGTVPPSAGLTSVPSPPGSPPPSLTPPALPQAPGTPARGLFGAIEAPSRSAARSESCGVSRLTSRSRSRR